MLSSAASRVGRSLAQGLLQFTAGSVAAAAPAAHAAAATPRCFAHTARHGVVSRTQPPCLPPAGARRSSGASQPPPGGAKGKQPQEQALAEAQDPFSSLTDKIPVRPVTATETVSYSLVILAGLGVAAAAGYAVLKELVFEPKEYAVFGLALDRCRAHPVVGVRLGEPVTGYGVEGTSRSARQRIRHKLGRDAEGRETVTVQFQLRGPRGVGSVLAEARADGAASGGWAFNYLQVQDATGGRRPIIIIRNGQEYFEAEQPAAAGVAQRGALQHARIR